MLRLPSTRPEHNLIVYDKDTKVALLIGHMKPYKR